MAFDFSYPGTLPSEKGWGPGWPNCQSDKIVPLVVRGVPFRPGVRPEVRELLEIIIEEALDRGYIGSLMDPGCWGFGCRDTKRADGSTTGRPSVHSWGLAIDINAPRNAFGADEDRVEIRNTPAFDMEEFMEQYGFRWLGDDIKDWMHFDFCGTPEDAKRMTEKARLLLKDPRLDEMREGSRKFWAGVKFSSDWPLFQQFGFTLAQRGDNNPKPGTHTHSPTAHNHDDKADKVHGHPNLAKSPHVHGEDVSEG